MVSDRVPHLTNFDNNPEGGDQTTTIIIKKEWGKREHAR